MECRVLRQKKTEHFGAADDGNDAIADPELIERGLKIGADRVPQQGIRVRGIGCKRGDLTGQD